MRATLGTLLCTVLGAWVCAPASAQSGPEIGAPPLRTLLPEGLDAPPQTWSSARATDGSVWLATSAARLHRYDGASWTAVDTPGVVRALVVAPDGTVYWSCFDGFGRLVADETGEWRAEPLLDWLPAGDAAQLGNLKRAAVAAGRIAFQSTGATVLLDPTTRTARRWTTDPHQDGFEALGTIRGLLHTARSRSGLETLSPDGARTPADFAPAAPQAPAIAILERGGAGLVVTSAGQIVAESGEVVADLSATFTNLVVLHASAAPGQVFLATAGHGILIVDAVTGAIRRSFGRLDGLPSDKVHALRLDDDGSLWASTNRGTTVVDPASPWSRFGTDHGIRGRPLAMARHQGILHVATDEGLFRLLPGTSPLAPPRFAADPDHPVGAWDLLPFDDDLIVCAPPFVVALRGPEGSTELLHRSVTLAARSHRDPDVLFVAGSEGLFRIRRTGDTWAPAVPIELGCGPIGVLETAPDGTLWLGAGPGELWCVGDAETNDRPVARHWTPGAPWRLIPRPGELGPVLLCEDRIYAPDPRAPTDRPPTTAFEPLFPAMPHKHGRVRNAVVCADGRMLLSGPRELWMLLPDGQMTSLPRDIVAPGPAEQLLCEPGPTGMVAWLARDHEVLRVEVDGLRPTPTPRPPAARLDVEATDGVWSSGRATVRLHLEPSRPGVHQPSQTRARIADVDANFSSWESNGRFRWQRVPLGNHVVDIEMLTADGSHLLAWQEPLTVARTFWHRPLTWVLAAVLLTALGVVASRAAAVRLRRRNALLEAEVTRRTEQMELQRRSAEQAAAWLATTFHRCPASLWDIDGTAVRAELDRIAESATMPLRNQFESNPDQILRLVELTRIVDVNEAGLQLVGASDRQTLQERLTHLFTNDTLAMLGRVFTRLAAGNTSISDRCSMKAFDGRVIHVRLELAIPPGYERSWQRMILALLDQTAEVRTAEEHRVLEARSHDLSKLEGLGRLAGGVAHDFNNLLTAIAGNLDALSSFVPALPETREATESIELAVRRGADLCEQLLSFSGRGVQRIEPVDLSELTTEMLKVLGKSVPANATITRKLDPDLPRIRADATRLRQVLLNLIVNAAEALHEDGGVIELRTGVQRLKAPRVVSLGDRVPPGSYVVLDVIDDGCGISTDGLKRMIDPFFSTKGIGRGLGMAAVVGNVHAHGGFLEIDSEPDEGTHVRVWLPLTAADERPDRAGGPQSTVSPASAPRRATPGVLVVDTDEDVRRVAVRLLRASHVDAEPADSWQAALDAVRREPSRWNVVLLEQEVWVAEHSEIAAARELADLQVVFVLSTDAPAAATMIDAVVDGEAPTSGPVQITKPFSGKALAAAARAALATHGIEGGSPAP